MNRELIANLYNPPLSKIALAKGPLAIQQLNALITDKYWVILGIHRFNCEAVRSDSRLRTEVNSFKHCLQTFGPLASSELPDFRSGKGRTKGYVYHGHVRNSDGLEFIIEWTIIDVEKKIIAITGFAKHENFQFTKNPLSIQDKSEILSDVKNKKIIERASLLKIQAKNKATKIYAHHS